MLGAAFAGLSVYEGHYSQGRCMDDLCESWHVKSKSGQNALASWGAGFFRPSVFDLNGQESLLFDYDLLSKSLRITKEEKWQGRMSWQRLLGRRM
jgi:hypothetical protein